MSRPVTETEVDETPASQAQHRWKTTVDRPKAVDESKKCHACHTPFSFFARKHSCRACANVFCDACTRHRVRLHRTDITSSRVCASCYARLTSPRSSSSSSSTVRAVQPSSPPASPSAPEPRVLYHSRSLCARCSFIDRSGFTLRPSVVFASVPSELSEFTPGSLAIHKATVGALTSPKESQGAETAAMSVYLGVCCPVHPAEPYVLLCSSLSFFLRTLTYDHSFSPSPSSSSSSSSTVPPLPASALSSLLSRSLDLEDIASATQYRLRSNPKSLPLLLELTIYRDEQWLSEADVDREIAAFAAHFPPRHQFVLKVNGGLIERKSDMATLNAHVHRIVALTTAQHTPPPPSSIPAALLPRLLNLPVVVDLTFDRLIDLSLLPSSVLLKANVLPCVRYFLSSSSLADAFISELSSLINALHSIDDISLLLILTVDDPAPAHLPAVLDFLQTHHRIIRMVVVTRERSPSLIFQSLLATPPSSSSSAGPAGPAHSTDVYALLQALEGATHGRVHPADFVPFRVLSLLAPLLPRFGWGTFHPGASPFCLLATVLVNTSTLRSIPLTHLVDVQRLYHALLPVSARLSRGESLGVLQAKRVQSAIKACMIARLDCPDVLDYLTTSDVVKATRLKTFMRGLQVLVVHNKMDLASVDMQRRCECAVVERSPMKDGDWIATCTGCV